MNSARGAVAASVRRRRVASLLPARAYARSWRGIRRGAGQPETTAPGQDMLAKGERLAVAPRVLVDATAVPADRGAVGRYVDGLVHALEAAGADLAVVCQRADE